MKKEVSFVCQQCGNEQSKWMGRCPECAEWNTLVETTRFKQKGKKSTQQKNTDPVKPVVLNQVKSVKTSRISTHFGEFNRVLGGGIVPGAVVLVAGDPGVGKSTLLLSMIGKTGGVYVAGEESAQQVKLRAERLKVNQNIVTIITDTVIENIIYTLKNLDNIPQAVVIDSIQTLSSLTLDGIAGSVGQIRQSAQVLIQYAKREHVAVLVVGHVTKDGSIAGPKILEHMVDVVCYFEGDRYYQGRVLRTFKNRFGPTDEVGLFEMEENGFSEITNPSKLFLEGREQNVPGSAIGVTLEGTRPLLIEIQSLVVSSQLAMPRRVVNGIDYNRLQVILAILQKRLGLNFSQFDVFVNVSGGMKLREPAVDVPIALSLISAFKNSSLPGDLASFGEIGLLGEIRRVQGEKLRVKEAKRLGFKQIISPSKNKRIQKVVDRVFV